MTMMKIASLQIILNFFEFDKSDIIFAAVGVDQLISRFCSQVLEYFTLALATFLIQVSPVVFPRTRPPDFLTQK
jgi:hypothetical protein